jgi:hypothetical protein
MDSMNDAALDRDIERLLAVEPSPAFVARVRARVAEEPSSSSTLLGWRFAATVSMAAVACIAAIVVLRPDRRVEPAHRLLLSRALTSSVAVPTANVEPRTSNDEPQTTNLEQSSSEPLFDPRETTALQRLIAGVRDARVDLAPLANDAPMPLPSLDDLVIPPIAIQPLAPGGVEGERP